MENDDLGNELVRLDGGFLVDDETYVVNAEDVLEDENNSDSGSKHAPLREQDRFLPIANIAKIMKKAIPDNGKIAKDARECVQECISEFISFVTSEASDRCLVEKRKTINGEDVLFALNALGFDNYVEPLRLYLKKYREIVMSSVSQVSLKLTEKNEDNFIDYNDKSQVTINKVNNKTIVVYGGDGTCTVLQRETDGESQTDSAVPYDYPKVIEDFTIS